MNQTLRPGYTVTDEKGKKSTPYTFADTLSISLRARFDDIERQKAQRFDQGYLSESVAYFSGPAEKNLGFEVEYTLASQSPRFNKTANRYEVGPLESDFGTGLIRYYNGRPGRYFSAKIGQFGPLDGYGGSDRTISVTGSLLFGTVNKIGANRSQKGLDLGYTFGDNHISVIALAGVPSNGDGTQSRPGNHYDWEFQYLRWLDQAGSSVQLVYHLGQTPLNDSGSLVDNYGQLYLLGNWRKPLRNNRAFNLVVGYGTDSHDKLISPAAPATPSKNGRFGVESYFAEVNYEIGSKLAPYLRYDAIHSNETDFGDTASGNPIKHNNQWVIGLAQQAARNLRLNLEFAASRPTGSASVNQIRAQLWFIF